MIERQIRLAFLCFAFGNLCTEIGNAGFGGIGCFLTRLFFGSATLGTFAVLFHSAIGIPQVL